MRAHRRSCRPMQQMAAQQNINTIQDNQRDQPDYNAVQMSSSAADARANLNRMLCSVRNARITNRNNIVQHIECQFCDTIVIADSNELLEHR